MRDVTPDGNQLGPTRDPDVQTCETLRAQIAALAHDLANPIQNISNSCALLLRQPDDAELRAFCRQTLERETPRMEQLLAELQALGTVVVR